MAKSKKQSGTVNCSADAHEESDSTGSQSWEIELTETCAGLLAAIKDKRIQKIIGERIDGLQHNPEKQGKELRGPLKGYRSLRTVGQRYRIIYRVDDGLVVVLIVSLGIRKEGDKSDVYELTKKLLKLGLLDE